jgi:hypothetical protein
LEVCIDGELCLPCSLQKHILDVEPEPIRIVTKPYINGVLHHERAMKLIERFAELYGSERLEAMDSLRGLADRDINERFVFSIVEVSENFSVICKQLQLIRLPVSFHSSTCRVDPIALILKMFG